MIHSASESDFAKCHGLGPKKVARLMDVFDQPFLVGGGGGGK